MLIISSLEVACQGTLILQNFTLTLEPGQVHALMGPNGSGKSTLALTLLGHPAYTVTSGSMQYNGTDFTALSADKRARLGMFLVPQYSPELPGISISTFLRETYTAMTGKTVSVPEFQQLVHGAMDILAFDHAYLQRSMHEGFSGGQKKKLEMLQVLLCAPDLVILDEIDSGLDIDALKIVAQALAYARQKNPSMSVLMITHYPRLLSYIVPDVVHIMNKGTIACVGDAQLVAQLERRGFDSVQRNV